jgi:hypothetical protein
MYSGRVNSSSSTCVKIYYFQNIIRNEYFRFLNSLVYFIPIANMYK